MSAIILCFFFLFFFFSPDTDRGVFFFFFFLVFGARLWILDVRHVPLFVVIVFRLPLNFF